MTAEQVYLAVVDEVASAVGASTGGLWAVDEERRLLVMRRGLGYADAVRPHIDKLSLDDEGRFPVVDAVRNQQPIWFASQAALLERYPALEPLVTPGRGYATACLPILVHGRALALLGLTFEGAPPLDANARNFLLVVARYAGQALERLRLLEAERRSRERAEAFAARMASLSRASRAFAERADDLATLLDTIAKEVTTDEADACAVMLIAESGETLDLAATHHREPGAAEEGRAAMASGPMRVGEGGMGRVAATGEAILLPVIDREELLRTAHPPMRPWLEKHTPHSSVIVPMRARGRLIGTLAATRERPGPGFDESDQRFLEDFAERAAMAIERARLLADNRRALLRAELLYGLVRAVISADRVEQIYEAALGAIEQALGTHRASVLVFDEEGVMRFEAWRGLSDEYRQAVEGHSPWSRDSRDPTPIYSEDALHDPAFAAYRATFAKENVGAIGFIPLVAEGKLIGKFMVYYDRPRSLSAEERDVALAIANHVAGGVARFAAIASLERSVRFNEMFVGILGHDLRNPLGAIMTAAQLAMMRETSEKNIKPLARILTSGQRMARMIDQLLDFTRMRVGGGIPLTTRRVELMVLLRQALDELEDANPDCPFVLDAVGDTMGTWDEDRLLQVFSNLAGNAVQHRTADHGVHVRVDGTEPSVVRVAIHNDGAVPPELVPKIFDPMTGGHHRRSKATGLGLGLYITRQIVLAHGGTVELASSERDGTTFTVLLPRG